jgi:hypothetical protein
MAYWDDNAFCDLLDMLYFVVHCDLCGARVDAVLDKLRLVRQVGFAPLTHSAVLLAVWSGDILHSKHPSTTEACPVARFPLVMAG